MVSDRFYSVTIALQLTEPIFDDLFIKNEFQEYKSAILDEIRPEEQGCSCRFGNSRGR